MSRFDAPFEIVKSFGSGGEDECFVGGEFLPVYEDSPASKTSSSSTFYLLLQQLCSYDLVLLRNKKLIPGQCA